MQSLFNDISLTMCSLILSRILMLKKIQFLHHSPNQ